VPDRNSVTGEPEGSAPGIAARAASPIERVLVCVNEQAASAGLLHYGQRLASQRDARWTAIYVETARHRRLTESERDRVADCLRLAEKLGGDAMTLPGDRVADELLAFARENGVTQIVIGKSRPRHWFELWRPRVARTLARRARDIALHAVSADEAGLPPVAASTVATAAPSRHFDPLPYVVSIGLLALLTALGCIFRDYLKLTEVALIYLTLVLITAARFGLLPSLVLSALSMLAFDFFWVPPVYTWDIDDPRDWFVLLVLVAVAMCTSYLTARTGAQMMVARRHAKTTAELYSFSRRLSAISRLDLLLNTSAYQIGTMLRARVVILLSEGGRLVPRAAYRGPGPLGETELAAASWVWHNDRPAGHGADTLGGGSWLFLPLRTPRGMVAVLGIDRELPNSLLTPEERRLLDALADQAAVAVERVSLAAEIDETRVLRETERLRSALLTSISHDLRTPLASVLGALADLRREETLADPEARQELLDTAQEEAERLNRFVGNLLDITRLEAGALEIKGDMVDLVDVVGSAVRRARKLLGERRIKIELPDDLPMVRLDFVLFEHVLFNLLDNAAKYSPPASTVGIRASRSDQRIALEITDEGSGVPADDLERIFDKFYRLKAADRQRAGTGLGLAICRGFVDAQGGAIKAGNRSDRSGAVFTITLPVDSDAVAAPPEPAATP
jgi:two-component system, OmpR family, sensor histidine kinase KdpD